MADPVAKGEDDRIIMHLPAMRNQPNAADPKQEDRAPYQKQSRSVIKEEDFLAVHVERQHQHGKESTTRTQRGNEFQITRQVTSSARAGLLLLAQLGKLDEALNQSQTEKDEHREHQQPEGKFDSRGHLPRTQTKRVQPGQREDVKQSNLS